MPKKIHENRSILDSWKNSLKYYCFIFIKKINAHTIVLYMTKNMKIIWTNCKRYETVKTFSLEFNSFWMTKILATNYNKLGFAEARLMS